MTGRPIFVAVVLEPIATIVGRPLPRLSSRFGYAWTRGTIPRPPCSVYAPVPLAAPGAVFWGPPVALIGCFVPAHYSPLTISPRTSVKTSRTLCAFAILIRARCCARCLLRHDLRSLQLLVIFVAQVHNSARFDRYPLHSEDPQPLHISVSVHFLCREQNVPRTVPMRRVTSCRSSSRNSTRCNILSLSMHSVLRPSVLLDCWQYTLMLTSTQCSR